MLKNIRCSCSAVFAVSDLISPHVYPICCPECGLKILKINKGKIMNDALKKSDGGKNSFYDIPEWVLNVDDLAEYLDLRGDEFNILKSLWTNIGQRHDATNPLRESKKCLHYADRRFKRLEKDKTETT